LTKTEAHTRNRTITSAKYIDFPFRLSNYEWFGYMPMYS
jgi:hypothetical protein